VIRTLVYELVLSFGDLLQLQGIFHVTAKDLSFLLLPTP